MGFWECKYEELAAFNADRDKTKYTQDYIKKMQAMQIEYYKKLAAWAKAQGHIVI